ncbi:dihydrofolate reductase [Brooklawnia cerclae]|uniref:Dihydrofolate reductase n=1 Tax=Brooklawnia cerclae TaxID=349934 RepID=A0ABX0SFQ5_9ACTN|nr:dihydrofolate reductase [Brooklawnia cerclae]NIH56025.1 dihydrofolate reductase [Brooklawnia cerclae]
MPVVAIAVVARNGVIGDGHDQPFKFREDWARFKRVTMGHPLIMGRPTHEAMGLLPGRTSVVLTRHPEGLTFPRAEDGKPRGYAVSSIEQALEVARGLDDTVFIAGGGQVYRLAWPHVDELDLTRVHQDAAGDVVFPDVDPGGWLEVAREPHEQFDFVRYQRRSAR